MSERKTDIVIITVDGNDPEWRKKKNHYAGIAEGDARDIRFRSWDNLHYLFRGIEKFAPWVNKVFLVTDNQAPKWLNPDYEKLELVNHSDFIPEKYLPVFSANPIENNVFRIKGLSEQFVFFNDDTFLTDYVSEEQFFVDGLPCDFPRELPITAHDRTFAHIMINDILMLNENYRRQKVLKKHKKKFYSRQCKGGRKTNLVYKKNRRNVFFGFFNNHMPNPFLKSTCKAVWEENYRWLDETCSHRFRNDNDVNQYIFSHYQYVNGLFHPYEWENKARLFRCNDRNTKSIANAIVEQRYSMICINEADDINIETAKVVINSAFEQLLPEKSKFEL